MKELFTLYCNGDKDSANNKFPQVARFLTIYIEEAHAIDEWYVPNAKACIISHKTIEERIHAGKRFVKDFQFPIELVCDCMTDELNERFDAYPERLYIIEKGVVVYKGEPGPMGYKLSEVKEWLAKRYGDRHLVTEQKVSEASVGQC